MIHQSKAQNKREGYVAAGFECTDPVLEENQSYFYSLKDGMYRRHTFTEFSMNVDIVNKQFTPWADKVEQAVVEESEVVTVTATEPVVKKKSRKKKDQL
jgi:hypothetical protein